MVMRKLSIMPFLTYEYFAVGTVLDQTNKDFNISNSIYKYYAKHSDDQNKGSKILNFMEQSSHSFIFRKINYIIINLLFYFSL